MGLLFLIAFAAGGAIAHSPDILKAATAHSTAPEPIFKVTHLEGKPLFVRIVYLDQPPLEIPVPPLPVHSGDVPAAESVQPQVVVISNTATGVQGVLVEP